MSPWATSVGCAQRGAYRVNAIDGCGGWFEVYPESSKASLYKAGCPQ
jgi:hypothetical protein